ncbi:Mrp/NBP35 family ATP-binding protein [Methanococcus maripaludis]|jgi:Mrp family chromosome partitioning ATPase|uniref:Iron-sulfur cluster carrier protein n=3 Tax=Methanococcus maripaludis TaxID=39152 RepID=APBC_METMP|nr:Mrp/NBP35 family ATP-binding protein [Methanococcus maripaludis]Q6LZC5.1 RecName: Full=Iron-sulfur cluster carrier protein [Methanococcus maripaludis S2]MDK2929090.1 ATP-binding protein involved in chromosome partitioning [Methanococcus sp.]AVB75690.1 Septum site-determining protein MinD [Methanococcus maripaludis]MBA2846552.1 Mrp family chromosome partitioning ATPase [Methanococcus maripaludis]MBA2850886.1 Mrp family chromosome partitioning ATPase [Methanococcus maripaludis]MBA2858389.1 M
MAEECSGNCDSCGSSSDCSDTKKMMEQQNAQIRDNMSKIKYKIAVMSGKGGVGKSTVTVNLAATLNMMGYKVGVLDGDIHGPNIPQMLGVDQIQPMADENGIYPVSTPQGIKTMSIGYFLPDKNTPIIWRGPKASGAIRQFLSDVNWGELDFLLIDTPPGSGDIQITTLQAIPDIDGVVIVTTPEEVSVLDARKSVSAANTLEIPIIGIVENMGGFVCPECDKVIDIFGKGGGEKAAKELNVFFLGRIPLDIKARVASDRGVPMVTMDCKASEEFKKVVNTVLERIKKE